MRSADCATDVGGQRRTHRLPVLLWFALTITLALFGHDALMTSSSAAHAQEYVGEVASDLAGHRVDEQAKHRHTAGVDGASDESTPTAACGVLRQTLPPPAAGVTQVIADADSEHLFAADTLAISSKPAQPAYPEPTEPPDVRRALLQIYIV